MTGDGRPCSIGENQYSFQIINGFQSSTQSPFNIIPFLIFDGKDNAEELNKFEDLVDYFKTFKNDKKMFENGGIQLIYLSDMKNIFSISKFTGEEFPEDLEINKFEMNEDKSINFLYKKENNEKTEEMIEVSFRTLLEINQNFIQSNNDFLKDCKNYNEDGEESEDESENESEDDELIEDTNDMSDDDNNLDDKFSCHGKCIFCSKSLKFIRNNENGPFKMMHLKNIFNVSVIGFCEVHCDCRIIERLIIKIVGQDEENINKVQDYFIKNKLTRKSWRFKFDDKTESFSCSMIFGGEGIYFNF